MIDRIALGAGLVVLIFGVWFVGYQGRVDMHHSQIRGCERGKLDRAANARGWRQAQKARLATADNPNADYAERESAWVAARTYDRIADGLERRSRIDCEHAFPSPRVLPV